MTRPTRLLLTNDDGYTAEGLQVLADALESLGEVWVIAPSREQSAVSHAVTLHRPLRLQRLGHRRYTVDGTPTDCVAVGMGHLMASAPPDLVISGINFGVNMGADVHYSGTVSAAFEGVISGVAAMAVSQQVGEDFSYHPAAHFARLVAEWILSHGISENTLLNINVPAAKPEGVRLTRLGTRRYTEGVIRDEDPRGREIFWIGGGEPIWAAAPGTDFPAVDEGFISVTPLQLDMTSGRLLEQLEEEPPTWINHGRD